MSETEMMTEKQSNPRTLNGTVVSNKMDKTIVVLVERRVQHPLYGKIVRRSSKVHVHDAQNECEVGDVVTVREAPPMSKTKTWQLVSIDERAKGLRYISDFQNTMLEIIEDVMSPDQRTQIMDRLRAVKQDAPRENELADIEKATNDNE